MMRFAVLTVSVAVVLMSWAVAQADEPTQARGVVFDDANRNGVRDAGERGLADVRVSNGRDVVRTGPDGAYTLPVDDDTILFVIKPRNWMTPTDKLNVPRFYYIHKPAGTPKLKYPGVEPTGPLPASVDFALHEQPEPDRFEVLLFGDTQTGTIEDVAYLAHDIVEPLVGTTAAFGMTLGDLVSDRLELEEPVSRVIAHVGIPWHNVLGNHDEDYAAADDQHSDDHFERLFGPSYYSFDHGPVHFIVLDDIIWVGAQGDKKGDYHGGLGEKQMAFLRNDLAQVPAEQLVVLTMHIPIVEIAERADLYKLLAEHPHTVSFSAHYHFHKHWFLGAEDGWPGKTPHHHTSLVTACGSWWTGAPDEMGIPHTMMRDGGPNGWCIVTFNGNQHSVRFQAARRPADYQMSIWTPEVVPAAKTGETEVLVNVFVGSPLSVVEMRVGDGAWQRLEQTEREDPYYAAIKEAEKSDHPPRGRKMPKIMKCPHMWVGKLPASLSAGTQQIDVRTTDCWGQTYTASRLFRVE